MSRKGIDGIPDWNRVDRSGWPGNILAELPGPDDPQGILTSDLARRLDLVPYEQDGKLRPALNRLFKAGLVERVTTNSGWHRWRRARPPGASP
jgi:hypothetical protein